MTKNVFVIPVSKLQEGETTFSGRADKEFFAKFENNEVLSADLAVSLVADKHQSFIDIDCNIRGCITTACDRCLSPVSLPVYAAETLRLRLTPDAPMDESLEEVFMPDGSREIDLGQEIYDFSLLALPLKKIHKEGDCDKAALAHLSLEDDSAEETATDSPFANLADLLNNKL